MAIKVRWKFSCSVFICIFSACSLKLVDSVSSNDRSPSKDFTEHGITKPRIYHGRSKREISSSVDPGGKGGHTQDLIVFIDLNGIERILELTINYDLIGGSYFQKTQVNGSYNVHKPTVDELELCHYRGHIRHIPGSWVAISTCKGLKGVIYDGNDTFFIDEGPQNGLNYIYNGKHLRAGRNQSCGFPQSDKLLRLKRDTDAIRGPYNANRQSRYVELLLVVDHEEYKALRELEVVYQHCKDIANIINALFVPLNIFIALIGVVVWTEKNEIALSKNGDKTLTNFLHYRKEVLVKEHPNDNAQLLTRVQFEGGVVGKALKGPICTFEYSGGIFMDHSSVVGLVATTVAHELGHNFGMEHDRPDCECPDDRCIMAPSSSAMSPSHWSSCSLEFLAQAFEHGMDYCLRNKPTKLFDSPVCGNGFVEPGEQCDCGLPHRCNNPCCNATTCMLFSNASCATGECCDFKTCKPKNAGTECRSAEHECDLPEYCTGESEYCPTDVFKIDGESCSKGKAFCYQGKCRSHSDQCQLLWGPSGKNSDTQCYEKNIIGNVNGNCGYNRLNHTYIKCYNENVYCGMVHCSHYNERLEFGMESVAMLAHSFVSNGSTIIACRTAIVDLGLNEVDPGLAPDGAKCGDGKMCVNQKCMSVGDLRKMTVDSCPKDCNGNGICNSKGHCHCNRGFAPPLCDHPGAGGSTDSGPASDPNYGREVTIALNIIFLVIILLSIAAFLFIYYTRHNVKIWWKKSPTRHSSTPWECKRQSPSRGTSNLLPEATAIVDVGIIRDRSPGPKATLLNEKPTATVTPAKPKLNDLQSELFVKGKGFTIKPLKKPNDVTHNASLKNTDLNHEKSSSVMNPYTKYERVNSSPNDTSNSNSFKSKSPNWKNEEGRLRIISPPILPNVHFTNPRMKTKSNTVETKEPKDVVDTPTVVVSTRPKISDPVLEGTTAKELIAEGTCLVPTRKAPDVPLGNACDNNTETYDKELPPVPGQIGKVRPLSSPVELIDEKKLLKELKENKEYPTLTKIASLMKSASISRSSSINEKNKAKLKPEVKKLKFDREKLKNIEISNPIPQVDTVDAAEKKDSSVARAQSMREPSQPKANIQSFGSMRVPSGAKRPTSVHVPSRPTSPPPRPPPPKTLSQEYSYDDCLNLLAEKTAPLAHIDEENSPSPNNIYAVIEESPKANRKIENERKVHFDDEKYEDPKTLNVHSPPSEIKKSLNNVPSGSTESMGLLGEIVSEIQARNVDSIYSSGTLKKKKDKEKESENFENLNSNIYNSNLSSARSDVSSSSSSNGYLNPKNINSPMNLDYNNSVTKNVNQPKPYTSFNYLGRKTGAEEMPKVNNIDVNSYKPYTSSFVRNSGPLALKYRDKTGSKSQNEVSEETKNETVTPDVLPSENQCTPSSASPVVKSSFSRPSLLGAPVPPKLTPQSITSSFQKPKSEKADDSETSKTNAKPLKNVPNIPTSANLKRTLSGGKGPVSTTATPKPGVARPGVGVQRNVTTNLSSLHKKDGSVDKESEVPKAPTRPLPSIPTKTEVKQVKPDPASSSGKPLNTLPRKNSKENLLNKVPSTKKPPTEKKPEIGKTIPKKNSNVASLQSKFEGSGNNTENKKPIPPNAASKPKLNSESKTSAQ